jgi:hypothetical protein
MTKVTNVFFLIGFLVVILISCRHDQSEKKSETIALWTFDEQQGLYPSCVLSDHSENDFPLVLGLGGMIESGKYGNALSSNLQAEIIIPESKSTLFGMKAVPKAEGRTVEPMNWHNARFCALMTSGETHLRKEVGFKSATKSKLNLGSFDWTIEFWYITGEQGKNEGVVFEIGSGPRAENDSVTRLSLSANQQHFILYNQPSQSNVKIPTNLKTGKWQHFAFVFSEKEKLIRHYVDGRLENKAITANIQKLQIGAEDYMSIGRDGHWERPLIGKLDELRFSSGMVYDENFQVPVSFSYLYDGSTPDKVLKKEQALLFKGEAKLPIDLGIRKYLFIDDALIDEKSDVDFVANPPRKTELVIGNIEGSFRKHLNVIEDETGLLRLYNGVSDDFLAVRVSRDGINWEIPVLPNGKYKHHTNIVVHDPTGMGEVFIDPNASPEEKWKYISGFHDRGVFMYTSPDGYNFTRKKTAVLPFWAGSQSTIFYDAQQQKYIAYHRADFARGVGKATQREFVMSETDHPTRPWPFRPSTQQEGWQEAQSRRIKDLLPFYMDNGLLTPGGFAFEYPNIFKPTDDFDPIDSDVYVAKVTKYPWAPDVYMAFPIIYYHYKKSSPVTRSILWDERYQRGSGPLETQLAVSRDAENWQRFPRQSYVGIGKHAGRDVHTAYIAQGMIRRDEEIWQYYFGETQYHSAHVNDPGGRGVYRLVQRLDGFVSLDSPYDRDAYFITKPLVFEGNRLVLNIDTDATGYTQVGFLDENKRPIKGFSVDDCVYINGDFINTEVEWIKNIKQLEGTDPEDKNAMKKAVIKKDVSQLAGKTVRLIFRMRGAKLYAMQFIHK